MNLFNFFPSPGDFVVRLSPRERIEVRAFFGSFLLLTAFGVAAARAEQLDLTKAVDQMTP